MCSGNSGKVARKSHNCGMGITQTDIDAAQPFFRDLVEQSRTEQERDDANLGVPQTIGAFRKLMDALHFSAVLEQHTASSSPLQSNPCIVALIERLKDQEEKLASLPDTDALMGEIIRIARDVLLALKSRDETDAAEQSEATVAEARGDLREKLFYWRQVAASIFW